MTHRSHQVNALGLLLSQQQFHIHIACIHIVLCWWYAFGTQRLIDGGEHRDIGHRCIGRLDMRNHVHLLVLTGFRQVHFIADPVQVAFRAVAHLRIIRGIMTLGVGG